MPGVAVAQLNIVKEFPGNSSTSLGPMASVSEPPLRVVQLEQNIRFLQEQHHLMLSGLHKEIEALRQKNRDLQFQLVFSKGKTESNHSTTSPTVKDESTNSVKSSPRTSRDLSAEKTSPLKENDSSHNETDAERCERLEKELSTTNTALQTSLSRTVALQSLLHQHKMEESEVLEQSRECSAEATRLAEAERLVRRLRQETADQRRELQSIKASLSAGGRGRGGGHRTPAATPGGLSQAAFPPLWHQSNRENEYHGWSRNNRRSSEKNEPPNQASSSGTTAAVPPTTLPDLRTSNSYNNGNSNNSQNQNQSRRGNGGNHGYGNSHYYRNSDRGYRGGDRNNREDDTPQRRTYNTPELSEGEVEPTNENHPTHGGHNHRNNTYRNKRGQNKYQDKS